MRKLVLFCPLLLLVGYINAQVVENPVFDRTDNREFRICKVEFTKDTTFVYCTYSAEDNSWVYISDNTYMENVYDGKRYPILKVFGIPFGPQKRHFKDAEKINIVLYFPHVSTDRINIIETEEDGAFNIYGIDLTHSYNSSYTSEDIKKFFDAYQKSEEKEDWPDALEYTQKQLKATNYVQGVRSFASACSMYNMVMAYLRLEKYEKAIEWGKKAVEILRELPNDSIYLDVLGRTYGNIGTAYYMLKKNEISSDYMELSLATRRVKDGIGVLNYDEYLKNMASNYYYEGNYPKALLYGKEVVDIYAKKYNENPYKYEYVYINSLNNLCEYCRAMGKVDEAICFGDRALKLSNMSVCYNHEWLKFVTFNNLGAALLDFGKTDEGIGMLRTALNVARSYNFDNQNAVLYTRLLVASAFLDYKQDTLIASNEYKSILQLIEDSLSIDKRDYISYIGVLEKLYEINRWNNPGIAVQYLNKAITKQKEYSGENSIAYANLLLEKVSYMWLSSLYEDENDDSLLAYMRHAIDIVKKHINYSSQNMSYTERKRYWERYKEYFTWLIPTMCGMIKTDNGNALAYDAALFYKGMLLSAEREYKSIIRDGNNDEVYNLFQNYTNKLALLEKLYSVGDVGYNIDSLKSIMHNEEYLLSQKVTRFNRQFKGTNYTWSEIKSQLQEADVAIEILSYRSLNGQDIYYDAYVICNNSIAPQFIPLCSENQLKSLITDSIDYRGVSMLIWGNEKLHDVIKDAKNIYFSPTGLLNTIGIEYLPITGNRYIYDRFNLFRLSSTREICMKNNMISIDKVYLYGGLDYNSLAEQSNHKGNFSDRLSRSTIKSLTHRGGFDVLMGSMREVELIKSAMSKHKIECVVMSGTTGTEESIKKLSGRRLGILHLSTHGLYLPGNDTIIKESQNYRFLISDNTPADEEEMSLSHSFLVMSGGNALIRRDSIPIENEDGILTALEISHLDFTNLDLVVLSACETALGKIDAEGVYGLQRGFKMAGANTILMSLDKVDDEATRILMVEFYRNLISGKTKRQSLKEAQQYLRKVDNGKYDDPKYWASFIMLDGLN